MRPLYKPYWTAFACLACGMGSGWRLATAPALGGTNPPGGVVLHEVYASSGGDDGWRDEDGEVQDWIELHNRGEATVDLGGWSLTDDPVAPRKWVLPAVRLEPGGFLLVLASGKDRPASEGQPLHASFQLNENGEYLAVWDSDSPANRVDAWTNGFPPLAPGYSFGRAAGELVYFSQPTPGASNALAASLQGRVAAPEPSVPGGFRGSPVTIHLATATPEARILYTLDGSEPRPGRAATGDGPLEITPGGGKGLVTLRAAAFRDGWLASPVVTHSYLFPEAILGQSKSPAGFPATWRDASGRNVVTADYEMDPEVIGNAVYAGRARQALETLPALSVVTEAAGLFDSRTGIYANPERYGPAWERPCSVEFLDAHEGRRFQVNAGLRIQGGTSRIPTKAHKHSFRLLFRGEHGPRKLEWPLFPDSPVERFDTLILDAGLNLVWIHPEEAQRTLGQYVRDQVVADWQNAMGHPAPHGRFVHLYLNGLYWGLYGLHEQPDESFASAFFGGPETDWDVLKDTTSFEVLHGTDADWKAMLALAPQAGNDHAAWLTLGTHLDLAAFADYLLLNFYAGNTDWPHHNWYAARRRTDGDRWRFVSWDAEHVFKGLSDNRTGVKDPDTPGGLYQDLLAQPEFRLLMADRVQRHFQGDGVFAVDAARPAWDPAAPKRNRPAGAYLRRIAEVDLAVILESARWGDDRREPPYTRDVEWQTELNRLVNDYFPRRTAIVLQQLRNAGLLSSIPVPVLQPAGGLVPAGQTVILQGGEATVYYTLDGTDPRLSGSGEPTTMARRYVEPVAIDAHRRLRARARRGADWSALVEAEYRVPSLLPGLVISEILATPAGGEAGEFVELWNPGTAPMDIGGFSFSGVEGVLPPGLEIAPGARVVVASKTDPDGFRRRYPGVTIAGWFRGNLADGGERLALRNRRLETVASLAWRSSSAWPATAGGRSLELVDPRLDPFDPLSWRPSPLPHGTPGSPSDRPGLGPGPELSEIFAGGGSNRDADWIELHNPTDQTLSLAGWSLTDDPGRPRRFVFGSEAILEAGGYRVVDSAELGFGLDRDGDQVLLIEPAGDWVDAVSFGPQTERHGLGRLNDGDWVMTEPTRALPNQPAALAPRSALVLNEILANPESGQADWVEIQNRDPEKPATLTGCAFSVRGLQIASTEDTFLVRLPTFVAPRGFVVLRAERQGGAGSLDLRLPAAGGSLEVRTIEGTRLDAVTWGSAREGFAFGRLPDGHGAFRPLSRPTPGVANLPTPRWRSAGLGTDGRLVLVLEGGGVDPGSPLRLILERSSDLRTWEPWADESYTGSWTGHLERGEGGGGGEWRFFRARIE